MTFRNEIRSATADDAISLAPRLRAGDRAEIEAGTGEDAELVMLYCIALSEGAWTWTVNGVPVLIGGTSRHHMDPECAVPWALGSDDVLQQKELLLSIYDFFKKDTLRKYKRMENYVDARNAASIKFLTMAGFTIHPARPHGVSGLPFHRFTMERDVCVT